MPTNREPKSSSRSTGAAGQGDKANGSAAQTGNGSVRDEATTAASASAASGAQSSSTASNGSARNGDGAAKGILGGIQQRVTSRVDEQKNKAAEGLGGIADVFRNAGNELRGENEALAQYVDMASDQLRRFADTIRQRGVEDMLDDVSTFARQRPALFVGGAFLVGLGMARFLKSSAERGVREYGDFSDVDPMTAGTGSPSYSGDLEAGGY